MPEQKIIELRILDTEFTLKAKDNEEQIKLIADYVNKELERVKAANPFTNHIRVAVLGCMNITEKLFAAQDEAKIYDQEKNKEIGAINLIKEELCTATAQTEKEKAKAVILAEEKALLQSEIDEQNELLNQYREHLRQGKVESEANRKTILELQNQLFESQIELVKVNKNHIEKDIFKSIEDKIKID